MKITAIKQQLKRADRYSVYVDEMYTFSLSETALLQSGLHSGLELTSQEIADYKKLSADDKVYGQALRYVAMRTRSTWELSFYMERKGVEPSYITTIVEKMVALGLLNDEAYARSFVHDRQLLRPTSRRKLQLELRKKRISSDIISTVLGDELLAPERNALDEVIISKRRQTKYQDDQKLMQYLSRQGFSYGDIKAALRQDDDGY